MEGNEGLRGIEGWLRTAHIARWTGCLTARGGTPPIRLFFDAGDLVYAQSAGQGGTRLALPAYHAGLFERRRALASLRAGLDGPELALRLVYDLGWVTREELNEALAAWYADQALHAAMLVRPDFRASRGVRPPEGVLIVPQSAVKFAEAALARRNQVCAFLESLPYGVFTHLGARGVPRELCARFHPIGSYGYRMLSRMETPRGLCELADELGMERSQVARLALNLIEAGLAEVQDSEPAPCQGEEGANPFLRAELAS